MLSPWRSSVGSRVASRAQRAQRPAIGVAASTTGQHPRGPTQRALAPATHPGRRPASPLRASADAGDGPAASGSDPSQQEPAPQQLPTEGGAAAAEAAAEGLPDAGADEETLSPEAIKAMVEDQEALEEAFRSWELAQGVVEDPKGLYEYMDRAYAEGPRRVVTPLNALMEDLSGVPTTSYPAAVANDIVGMGTWRLKNSIDPIIEFIVPRIEGCWREILDTDLCLYPREKWKAQGWDLADSEDPQRQLDGFSIADIPDPEKGQPGYPRLVLENRVYCSKIFRKLHAEICVRQDGLQVLHVVVFPRYSYDLPIFGMDVVMFGDRVSLAVVDLCPVRRGLQLQPHFLEAMSVLQEAFFEGTDPANRRVPDWGKATFSPLAVVMTPKDEHELACFVKYTIALHRAYLQMSRNAVPLVAAPGDRRAAARLEEVLEGQQRFCDNQLSNKKTRRVLEVAFGEEWTESYMSQLMFDFDPSYEPPYFDASYEKLYQYFDENPSFGEMAEEADELEREAEASRVAEVMASEAVGRPVSNAKLEMAMRFLMQNDDTFRRAMQAVAGKDEVPEELLSEELVSYLRSTGNELSKKEG